MRRSPSPPVRVAEIPEDEPEDEPTGFILECSPNSPYEASAEADDVPLKRHLWVITRGYSFRTIAAPNRAHWFWDSVQFDSDHLDLCEQCMPDDVKPPRIATRRRPWRGLRPVR